MKENETSMLDFPISGEFVRLSRIFHCQAAWLPVVVRSWTSVRLEYSVAHYTYASRGFDYAAAYSFNDDAICGQRTYTTHSGKNFTNHNFPLPFTIQLCHSF